MFASTWLSAKLNAATVRLPLAALPDFVVDELLLLLESFPVPQAASTSAASGAITAARAVRRLLPVVPGNVRIARPALCVPATATCGRRVSERGRTTPRPKPRTPG